MSPVTKDHWIRHGRFSEEANQLIDWDMATKAMIKLKPARRRWVTKHGSENCGVGKTLVAWKQQTDPTCPRCEAEEDATHVLKCTGRGACEVWNKNMQELKTFLLKSCTMPAIREAILTCLQDWRDGNPICLSNLHPDVIDTVLEQNTIGWKNFLEGLPCSGWANLQQQYYNSKGRRWSSTKWMTGLLKKLHNLAWHQWDHRNKVKHITDKPRDKLAESQLNWEITHLLLQGAGGLPACHRYHFRHSLPSLLGKSLDYRKAWLKNVLEAKDHQEKVRTQNMEATLKTGKQQLLIKWMRTNRAS
jgi:hypothetical protein